MSTSIAKATAKQFNNIKQQDSHLLKQVLQKVKPQMMVEEEVWTVTSNRLLFLNMTKQKKADSTTTTNDPDAVFNSLLHKSASLSTKHHRMNYEENFNNIYNK